MNRNTRIVNQSAVPVSSPEKYEGRQFVTLGTFTVSQNRSHLYFNVHMDRKAVKVCYYALTWRGKWNHVIESHIVI